MVGKLVALLLVGHIACNAVELEESAAANPIRKVVTMLQMMQGKVTAEGKKAEALYDKYMCYCKNADSVLGKSIADAENKIPQVEAAIKEDAALKDQLEADLVKHKADREQAKGDVASATALRKKENAEFVDDSTKTKTNIDALAKAIPALEKGMAGGFLQTRAASVLRQLSVTMDMSESDRDMLASFLSEGASASYTPQSGEIVGILKQMSDEMTADLASLKATEAQRQADFEALVAAKEKEIAANTKAIESKTQRAGDLAVKLAETENDLEDTKEQLEEDKKFLADLEANCDKKTAEWAEYKKIQAQEMLALADTIKVLNDDDALELFKKTLPSGASSFMQTQTSQKAILRKALSVLHGKGKDPRMDFLEIALHGGKIGFEKIIKMIDGLVAELHTEQKTDDDKKAYCLAEFDKNDDIKKGLEQDISDTDKAIQNNIDTIATLASEIKALTDAIAALDKQVAEATAQRKEEHEDNTATIAANGAAADLLRFAKNRLNKFYNPKLYKPPPKRQLSEEDRIVVNMGGEAPAEAPAGGIAGTGISAIQAAPGPPPEANLAYQKKGEESTGVIAMIDSLIGDLEKDNQVLAMTEKNSQGDYETFMADSQAKRALDSKAIVDKQSAKADNEGELQANKETMTSKKTSLMENGKIIAGLHQECDWLLKYFDARKEARTGEIDALGKAKDVLRGADFE